MIVIEQKSETVETEHLGAVEVRAMRYSERQQCVKQDDETQFMLTLLELSTLVDGERIDADRWDIVAGQHLRDTMLVFKAACALNGFVPEVTEGN